MAVRMPSPCVELAGDLLAGADLAMQSPQPVQLSIVDVARLLADRDLEVADVAVDASPPRDQV